MFMVETNYYIIYKKETQEECWTRITTVSNKKLATKLFVNIAENCLETNYEFELVVATLNSNKGEYEYKTIAKWSV